MSLTTKQREQLWDACRGDAELPTCNICHLPIQRGQRWHESHNPLLPRALGGMVTGIAHERCNLDHAAKHDVPLIAKNNRQRQKDIGAYVKRQHRPMPGTKASGIKIPFRGPTVWRDSGRPIGRSRHEN